MKWYINNRYQKEKNGAVTKDSDEIKVMYTNIDGIIARKTELVDYLKEKKPEIICLAETNLREEIQTDIENYYIIYGGRIEKTKKVVV